jgi:hypothetical protein
MGGSDNQPILKNKSLITPMKYLVTRTLLLATICIGQKAAQAQKTENFNLQPKKVQIPAAIFSKVEVLDVRYDTAIGFVQRGGLNRKVSLTLAQPLQNEIVTTAGKMIDGANKQEGTLLIRLRRFHVGEINGYMSEKGAFEFKAFFYLKQDAGYRYLFSIDSTVTVRAGGDLDVTTKLLDTVPEVYGGYIKLAAGFDISKAGPRQYTADELQHMDELEKKEIPVYNVAVPKKGLYLNYEDFRDNRPSREDIIVDHRKGFSRPFIYEMKGDNKKGKEIPSKSYYVVCDGEKMYVGRPHNLYELIKKDNDFWFTGIGKDEADMGTMILAGALGGIAGGVAGSHDTAIFEFKIDHLTGKFIPMRKIKD